MSQGQTERLYKEGEAVALAWSGMRLGLATPAGVSIADFGEDGMEKGGGFLPLFAPTGGCLPLLASNGDFLAGATRAGEVVVWDLASRREVGRRSGGPSLAGASDALVLALAPSGMQFYLGDGQTDLFRVGLDSPLPQPVGYPGPGQVLALGFDAAGQLRALPSRWAWSPSTGAWTEAAGLDFLHADGRNKLAIAPGADLVATYRHERPMLLRCASGELVDLGYREAMDLALDPAGDLALVSFPGAEGQTGYGPGVVSDEPLLGSLESFDPKTGARLAQLPREGAVLSPAEAVGHRTLGLGLRMAALGDGRFATVDFVDHKGEPSLFLRIRGRDLVATSELALDTGTWPLHLATGGGLLAIAYEEATVDVFDIATLSGESTPLISLPISAQADPTGQHVPAPRDVFAIARDGNLLAMTGPSGTVFFANPRTGWPHQVVSVNVPKGAGRPRSARFEADGGLTLVTEDVDTDGEALGLFERTLDATQTRWSEPTRVAAVGQVSADTKVRVELRHGSRGNLDVYRGAIASGSLLGQLVSRTEVVGTAVDAIAISADGKLAWAQAGHVMHIATQDGEPDAPR